MNEKRKDIKLEVSWQWEKFDKYGLNKSSVVDDITSDDHVQKQNRKMLLVTKQPFSIHIAFATDIFRLN